MTGTVLILGASGRFGRHTAEAFWNAGWRVKEFNRATDDLMQSAKDTDVIVNGWNPPYTDWAQQVPNLTNQIIAAAKASGATVIVQGNVYGFGKGAGPNLAKETPQNATNPLGRTRIDMENAYRAANIQTIVLRAGDFIDTEASGNWFDKIIVAKAAKGRISAPGNPILPHAWAYLPDVARAVVEIAEKRETLEHFEDVPFTGFTLSVDQIGALVAEASGRAQTVKRMNWAPVQIASPFWAMGRKLLEMRYLWDMPHQLDGTYFASLLPDFRATEPLVAVAKAIGHLKIDPDKPMTRSKPHVLAQ